MKFAVKLVLASLLAPAAAHAAPSIDFSKINRNLADVVGVTMNDPEIKTLFSQAQIAFDPAKSKVQVCNGCDQRINGVISVTARYSAWSKDQTSLQGNFDINAKGKDVTTTAAATLKTSTLDLTKYVLRFFAASSANPCNDREFLQRNGRVGQQYCANFASIPAVKTFDQLAEVLVKEADLVNAMIEHGTFFKSASDPVDKLIWNQIYKGFVEYKTAPKRDAAGRKFLSFTVKPETGDFFGITGFAATYAQTGISLKVQFVSKRADTTQYEGSTIQELLSLESMNQGTREEVAQELKGFIQFAKQIIFNKSN